MDQEEACMKVFLRDSLGNWGNSTSVPGRMSIHDGEGTELCSLEELQFNTCININEAKHLDKVYLRLNAVDRLVFPPTLPLNPIPDQNYFYNIMLMERNPDPVISSPVFRPARDPVLEWILIVAIVAIVVIVGIVVVVPIKRLFKYILKRYKNEFKPWFRPTYEQYLHWKTRDNFNVPYPKELEPATDESGLSDLIAPEIISNGTVLPPRILVETTESGLDPRAYQDFLHRKVYKVPVADETIDKPRKVYIATSEKTEEPPKADGRPKSPTMYNVPFEMTPKAPKVYSAPTEKTVERSKARKILSPVLKKKPEPTTMADPEPEERWGI